MQRAVDAYGALHILVNNAGTTRFIAHGDLEAVTDEAWDEIFDTNVRGTFYATRAAAPHMRAAGEGAIVNVASAAGVFAGGSSIPYGASKAAVINMTRYLGRALAPEIRVNAVAPGYVDTPWLTRGLGDGYDDFVRRQARRNPMGGIATPEMVADSILSLIRHNDFVTGQTLILDGGGSL
jgi:NAD(P)-dependent dehydrogenase (short-subunit alcohol dehydrogenase family)